MRILHVHTGQKVLVPSAPLVQQLYSAGNILTQVFDALCVHFSRDVRSTFCLGSEPSQKLVKVKAMAGQVVTITVGFSFNSTFLSLLIDGRAATTLTDRHQLGTCHLLNVFDAIFPPWPLTLPVFMQLSTDLPPAATCRCDKQTACALGLCAARHLSPSVMRLQLAFDFVLQLAHGCAPFSKNGFSATVFLNA